MTIRRAGLYNVLYFYSRMEKQTSSSQQFPWSLSCKLPIQNVSSQDIRSFLFPVTFLFKTYTALFFYEIAMFSSRLLSFNNFFQHHEYIDNLSTQFFSRSQANSGEVLTNSNSLTKDLNSIHFHALWHHIKLKK